MKAINKKPGYKSLTIATELQSFGLILLFSLLELSLFIIWQTLGSLYGEHLVICTCMHVSLSVCMHRSILYLHRDRELGGEREGLRWLGSSHLV